MHKLTKHHVNPKISCVLVLPEVKNKAIVKSVNLFREHIIVRRELSDNFCYYNTETYNKLEGAPRWAQLTLNEHATDKRDYTYTLEEFKHGRTHDELWNATQKELYKTGKMHVYMRIYWAKKILEWTETPTQALEYALYLNNHYALDGNDPNAYVGCMASIAGVHDRGFRSRDVFGKIRYMSYDGCKKKFNTKSYIARWNTVERKPKKKNLLLFTESFCLCPNF
ncbi:deoxyribodipyrimidine photo-lyase [Chrysoperla carnea]|uniref:deoxyribodipyrimidine photo-lyase n=1 Tax=Chrysoperla carnea TaxID=189513 RepID=UPI001D063FAA|nr:deoxyribodipyrimidine photo-lyase [Chrysoperla carnea]